ncbi:MAG: hypothetical protein KIT31_43290, partial [Deltaproteobacteria bacterium]|nr:hypothetical protein [Deltaproteobacteria bacterium]
PAHPAPPRGPAARIPPQHARPAMRRRRSGGPLRSCDAIARIDGVLVVAAVIVATLRRCDAIA